MYSSVVLSVYLYCCETDLWNVFSCKTGTLYPLNNSSSWLLILAPGNHHSTSHSYKFDHFRYLIVGLYYLSFTQYCIVFVLDWLISLGIMSSMFMHVRGRNTSELILEITITLITNQTKLSAAQKKLQASRAISLMNIDPKISAKY